ncbi:MAG: holo-ACP synthase [Deltaproteobacteria bacterium]|nr:holo-ACP synthase [Deltaproteobacteria bacterium]
MLVGLGMDLVEVERIRRAVRRHGQRFLTRVYTTEEAAYCTGRGEQCDESLAARYAAKEAAWKALGVPPALRWTDLEVVPAAPGRAPTVRFTRLAADVAARLGVRRVHLALTHAGGVSGAVVILEGGGG